MTLILSEKKIHKIWRIDQAVRDYFETNRSVIEILAIDLMPLFIREGIFLQDHRKGFPIRTLLQQLDKENRLSLLKHVNVVRKDNNHNWYFIKK